MSTSYTKIALDGLWDNNPGFVQLLGLCPLLAVSATMVNALGLGFATTLTLLTSNLMVSMVRHQIPKEIRLPVFVLIIASIVTAIELVMNAYLHDLYRILGIFIPLIVTNCVIIGRAEAFASKHSPAKAAFDGFTMGMGFTLVLVLLAAMREILGRGTLFDQIELLFGEGSQWMTITVFDHYRGFLFAVLPPGAFIGLGLLLAVKNMIDKSRQKRLQNKQMAPKLAPA